MPFLRRADRIAAVQSSRETKVAKTAGIAFGVPIQILFYISGPERLAKAATGDGFADAADCVAFRQHKISFITKSKPAVASVIEVVRVQADLYGRV